MTQPSTEPPTNGQSVFTDAIPLSLVGTARQLTNALMVPRSFLEQSTVDPIAR